MAEDVKDFYNSYSKRFSQTRHAIWDVIINFNKSIKPESKILDAGCGNGKNMVYLQNNGHIVNGIDFSEKLLDICRDKILDVEYADIRKLTYENETFDYVISIAVIHHLSTSNEQYKALNELLRVTKKGGKVLFTVWAVEQEEHSRRELQLGSNLVPFENTLRYYYVFSQKTFQDFIIPFNVEKVFWEKGNWNAILIKS
jgi:ubiquinone/menaquinone biosynthesis C-methylase UbiE